MSEAVIRIACDRMECGPVEMTPIGSRQLIRFWRVLDGQERQVSQMLLEWPPLELPRATLDVQAPHRGVGD